MSDDYTIKDNETITADAEVVAIFDGYAHASGRPFQVIALRPVGLPTDEEPILFIDTLRYNAYLFDTPDVGGMFVVVTHALRGRMYLDDAFDPDGASRHGARVDEAQRRREARRCTAVAKSSGRRCRRPMTADTGFCASHQGRGTVADVLAALEPDAA